MSVNLKKLIADLYADLGYVGDIHNFYVFIPKSDDDGLFGVFLYQPGDLKDYYLYKKLNNYE